MGDGPFGDRRNAMLYFPFCQPRLTRAEVAQLVEHTTENRSVGSSILPLGTNQINNLQIAADAA